MLKYVIDYKRLAQRINKFVKPNPNNEPEIKYKNATNTKTVWSVAEIPHSTFEIKG